MQLTKLQQEKVDEILHYYDPLRNGITCEFKAPTGSGKTLMAAAFISNLIAQHGDDQLLFVVATPSSAELPLAFEMKLNRYKADLPYSRFEVEYVKSPSSAKNDHYEASPRIIPERNKVYIFGKASFGKGRILQEYGIIDDFIQECETLGFRIIYIRDEAHIGGSGIDPKSMGRFEDLMNKYSSFVLKMTATPNYKVLSHKVVLREKELNDERLNEGRYLLKTTPTPILDKDMADTEVLANAIAKFKEVKAAYDRLSIGIHPAMLIQVDNSSEINSQRAIAFEEELRKIKRQLNEANMAWAQYFGDGKKDSNRVYKNDFTLDDLTQNNSDIDVVIFKIGPSTGWDIPRACMLVQLRHVSSTSLNTQTLGRIKRNPYPGLIKHEVTDRYYVLSNLKETDRELRTYHYSVRQRYNNDTFLKIEITNRDKLNEQLTKNEYLALYKVLHGRLTDYMAQSKEMLMQDMNRCFDNGIYKKLLFTTTEGNKITTNITNPFVFLRDYRRLIDANQNLYNNTVAVVEIYADTWGIQKQMLYTILFELHKKELQDILDSVREFKPVYQIFEERYIPSDYSEVYTTSDTEVLVHKDTNQTYLFDITTSNQSNNDEQPLDSKPEGAVFKAISQNSSGIRIWAKNQTSSNVFGRYVDENNNLCRSFFDFIVKFENGIFLYIEVKSESDINSEKTELLKNAYKAYFDNSIKNALLPQLLIAVCKVDHHSTIHTELYCSNKEQQNALNQMSFENILKELAQLHGPNHSA